jgi:hypothetical protein
MADDIKKQIKDFEAALKASLNSFARGPNLNNYGKMAVDIIYKRTKSGWGVDSDKDEQAFKVRHDPLDDDYIKERKKALKGAVASTNRTFVERLKVATGLKSQKKSANKSRKDRAIKKFGPFFSPARSNLTFTGQLLESLKYKVSDGIIRVFVDGKRDDGLDNQDVLEGLSKNNRRFLNLAVEEKQILLRKVENDLIKFIRLLFNKRG